MKLLAILLLFCPTFVAQELAALAGWIPESNVENEVSMIVRSKDALDINI